MVESALERQHPELSEDSVEQMLALAERLREDNGGELDESAIQAVAEATGAPVEYVRLAVMLRAEKEKKSLLAQVRAQFLSLSSNTRRYVSSGIASVICAIFSVMGTNVDRLQLFVNGNSYGFFGMLAIISLGFGIYNAGIARDSRAAAITGAIFGGGYYLLSATFSMALQTRHSYSEYMLVPLTAIGAIVGLGIFKIFEANRQRWGLKDPVKDRQDLLRQLVELQDTLRQGEQSITFLSLDIVGSTRMKEVSDPLAVEFTFNEYHSYAERLCRKYGGRIHSTAGDGIICAFENPANAFGAAKNIQAELIELNNFRNKIGIPIVLRAGIHSGNVVSPDATDVTTLNFAHVIDVAAHIQKICPAGGVAVSETAALGLPGGLDAVGNQRTRYMTTDVAIWAPKAVAQTTTSRDLPPLPEGA
jgi:class 3 adenylate cyclase